MSWTMGDVLVEVAIEVGSQLVGILVWWIQVECRIVDVVQFLLGHQRSIQECCWVVTF